MDSIIYQELKADQITPDLFRGFSRHQVVKRCWRKEDGQWQLKDIAFTEEWDAADFDQLAAALRRILSEGGGVVAGLDHDRLAGFASVDGLLFGSRNQYVNLSNLHVSFEYRGRGIGRRLFKRICEEARRLHAEKLYISAHSSEESQAFYRSVGCVEAIEYNQMLVEKEPCDCQMEFVL